MRISSMAFHALSLLFTLGQQPKESPISVSELATKYDISEHFIQKILRALRLKGIVNSIRGIAGGHVLAKSPDNISLADIIFAVEGDTNFPQTKKSSPAKEAVMSAWIFANEAIQKELQMITLSDLMNHNASEVAQEEIDGEKCTTKKTAKQENLSLARTRSKKANKKNLLANSSDKKN